MKLLALASSWIVLALVSFSPSAGADATDCMTLGECAADISWDVQVGATHTTITIHHPNEAPVVKERPNNSSDPVSGHGVSVSPSGSKTWSQVVNCAGTSYACY